MTKRHWAHMLAVAVLATAALAAAAPAAAATPGAVAEDGSAAAAAAAREYLEARAAAIGAPRPAAVLRARVAAGSALTRTEAQVATGTALRGRHAGRRLTAVACDVTVLKTRLDLGGMTARVTAHAVTRLTWRSSGGRTDVEGSGLDHELTLVRHGDTWRVAADAYTDVLTAAYLEAAGAPRTRVRAAARRSERAAPPVRLPRAASSLPSRVVDAAAVMPARGYIDVVMYDRAAAQTYADKYALSYNATYARFPGADCANFASQCAFAGKMLTAPGAYTSGWWYDKHGTSSPSDDTYSMSWINVTKQMSFWAGRRIDWQPTISGVGRGDFVYYDWTGDGVWDHVAILVGTNSSGQKVIDAHTTDHYRVFWKLGSAATKYKFAKVQAQWKIG